MQWVLLYSWHRQKCIRGAESGGNLPFNTISALLCYQLTDVVGRVQRAPSLLRGWGVKIWVTPQICGHSGEQGWDFLLPGGSALITASASPEAPSDLFEPLRILYNPIVCIHFRATLCWIIQIQKKPPPICIHGHLMCWHFFGKYANQLQFGADPVHIQSGSRELGLCKIEFLQLASFPACFIYLENKWVAGTSSRLLPSQQMICSSRESEVRIIRL